MSIASSLTRFTFLVITILFEKSVYNVHVHTVVTFFPVMQRQVFRSILVLYKLTTLCFRIKKKKVL